MHLSPKVLMTNFNSPASSHSKVFSVVKLQSSVSIDPTSFRYHQNTLCISVVVFVMCCYLMPLFCARQTNEKLLEKLYWNKSFFFFLQISQVPREEVKLKGTRYNKAACWLTGVLRRGGGKMFFFLAQSYHSVALKARQVYETDLELTWLLKHCRLNICVCDTSVRTLWKGAVSWRWKTKMGKKRKKLDTITE